MSGRRQGGKIVILGEGAVEKNAVDLFIRPQWEKDGLQEISLKPIDLKGKLEDIKDFAEEYYATRARQNVIAVFTLVDLYGAEQVKHKPDDELDAKVKRLRKWLTDLADIKAEKFYRPHISVHEIEALFLAEGKSLKARLNNANIKPARNAEALNFARPPAQRVHEYYQRNGFKSGYERQKTTESAWLFKRLDFADVYKTCDYFRAFYDELKKAAGA